MNEIPADVVESLRIAAEYYHGKTQQLGNILEMKRQVEAHKKNMLTTAHNAANAIESLRVALDSFSVEPIPGYAEKCGAFLKCTDDHVTNALKQIHDVEASAIQQERVCMAQLGKFDEITKCKHPGCPVCYESNESTRLVVSVQCGHVLCVDCQAKLLDGRCPTCRTPVNNYLRIYF
jgi:hypothetical protein